MKELFIPCTENRYKPKLLRNEFFFLFLGGILLVEAAFLIASFVFSRYGGEFAASVIVSSLIENTNKEREEVGLNTLSINPRLGLAAELKAKDMAARGYFSHVSPSGEKPWAWLDRAGYFYSYAGENLAVNFTESKDVTDAWLKSSTHRANLLGGQFRDVGVGVARGEYEGKSATFVVQFFATPAGAGTTLSAGSEGVDPISGGERLSSGISQIAGASTDVSSPNYPWYVRVFWELRDNVGLLYKTLLVFFSALLLAALLIELTIQHREVIRNGLILIASVTLILFLNASVFVSVPELPVDASSNTVSIQNN